MKYVVCVPDGCADEPFEGLGGRTPLEVAHTPVLDALAARGTVGRAGVIPDGMPAGSDVGNMAILGYDPAEFHTGRAPIEAASLGLRLPADRLAYRCNLVTVGDDGTMVDFAGGHPSTEDAAKVLEDLDATLGRGNPDSQLEFHAGVEYRHIMVAPADWLDAECIPPHDLTGKPGVWPTGAAAARLDEVMLASRAVLARHPEVDANQVWLWGQGFQPSMPSFTDQHGITGGITTAVDLVRGLGVLTDMALPDVEGANAGYDNDYAAQRDAALAGLADGLDLFVIHVEATDEAGHAGDAAEKVRSLELWDAEILADLVPALDDLGPWRLLLLPDHATPLRLRTHTPDPVPYVLVDSAADGPGGTYTEAGVADAPVVPGHELLGRLIAG
ncbi:2,3-bisphosphoglycerate-independent phosphoglycerate mutase [Dermatobacter hominis]|uniref:2,3-bisphosphoglycerate-independent phosphoglycerate mutase n=1 Tax=Dermatobacter hominis TaxID=2884263 RepID=UPI001D11B45F|nr:2,3-bisphosphoglycerate-independent phosphoglycerate mutase [Dermatobacter hominis]UDY37227.1 2,3-bisphosphoglycerate-independent phosphoglycerate mutase [Dermatobacter hominis]